MNNVKSHWKIHDVTGLLLVFTSWCLILCSIQALDCDVRITSGSDPANGTFHSPVYPLSNRGLRCMYTFIATEQQKVQVNFTEFKLRGVSPKCSYDYIDVYTQIKDPTENLLDAPLHGRFCGNNPDDLPHLLVSMYNIIIFGFYAESKRKDQSRDVGLGFTGMYSFKDAGEYTIGVPDPTVCGQTISGSVVPSGILLSPTYPGVYPDNIFCYYKLQGLPGQRIRFTFLDLDLYSGGDHCPFDYVKIYDGYTNQENTIGTYCGRQKNLVIYSTAEALHIEFRTKSGRVNPTIKPYLAYWEKHKDQIVQRKGFKAEFEISRRFVDLSFIKEGTHITGTECDQRVMSKTESNGTITSPNFPYKYLLNVTCHYFVDGLVDRQNLEKVKLTFDTLDIPKGSNGRCDNGHLKVYTRGQDMLRDGPDDTLCGTDPPGMLETTDPRLLLAFSSAGARVAGRGFRANYQFVTDYGIPGTPVSEAKCHFKYLSSDDKTKNSGIFNSPRYPSNYPHNTVCTYEFKSEPEEELHIRITFEHFTIENRLNNCSTDYIEVYKMVNRPSFSNMTKIGHYCGDKLPGPIVLDTTALKFIFHTDHDTFKSGFQARYEFLERKSIEETTTYCGDQRIESGGGGVIFSPNYPSKYRLGFTCEWTIIAHKGAHIMIVLDNKFDMEGNKGADGHGCGNAVLKIYTRKLPGTATHEICGKNLEQYQFISERQYIRIQFISSLRAIGAKGFKITWTEIYPSSDKECSDFECKVNKYCISEHLKCNKHPNCGIDDDSDEKDNCSRDYADQSVLHIILGVVISLIALVFIIVCILHRRRKNQKKRNKKEIEVRYVTRAAVPNHNKYADHNHDYADRNLLTERTEKVSIV